MTRAGDTGLQVPGGRQISKQAMLVHCDETMTGEVHSALNTWEIGKSLAELEDYE